MLLSYLHSSDVEIISFSVHHCVAEGRDVQQCQCPVPHAVCGWKLCCDPTSPAMRITDVPL